jgi:hypothetical protein
VSTLQNLRRTARSATTTVNVVPTSNNPVSLAALAASKPQHATTSHFRLDDAT